MKFFLCYLLAFVTGASGLISQVVWARQFSQVFGTSTQSVAIVLAIFLGGLSLGAGLLGRLADRTKHPLRLAAWFLFASSLLAVGGFATILPGAALLDTFFSQSLNAPQNLRIFYQAVYASLVLLPSTILLGGIAPALLRAMVSDVTTVRPGFSSLFAIETFGGACGGLAAGFWLIASFGVQGAMWFAAALSIFAATAIALYEAGSTRRRKASIPSPCDDTANDSPDVSASDSADDSPDSIVSPADRRLLVAVGLAGFSVLGMEVAWTRLLLLLLGGDTYAHTIVISSFLLGLSLGGLIARWFTSWLTRPLLTYGWLQLIASGTTLALLILFSWLSGGVGQAWMASLERDWAMVLGGRFSLCFAILLVPSVLAGLSFPVAASHYLGQRYNMGRRAGRLYAASAMGNVIGSLATGLLLIRVAGLQWTVVSLAAINLVAAACVVLPAFDSLRPAKPDTSSRRQVAWWQTALIVGGLAVCASWGLIWPVKPLGVNRDGVTNEVVFYREELTGIVAVLQSREFPQERFMSIDGIVIGQSHGGVDEKQRMLAHLPLLLRPRQDHNRFFTIGLGTGILAGELRHQSSDAEVVCVELSPSVIEGARQFADVNRQVHDDAQVDVLAGDGIHYLRRNSTPFDAIVSDAKSRPGHSGNSAFYSVDFYTLCRKRLAPGGLMAQWISLETPERELQTILGTFRHSFPHSYFGIAAPDSMYLIGSEQPIDIDLAHIQEHLDSPTASELRKYGWRDACDILALLAADGATVDAWLGGNHQLNTLARPILEYQSLESLQTSTTVRKQENSVALLGLTERPPSSLRIAVDDESKWRQCSRTARLLLEAKVLLGDAKLEDALARLDEGMPYAAQHTRFRNYAGEVYLRQAMAAEEANDTTSAIHYYRKFAETLDADDSAEHWRLAVTFQRLGVLSQSADEFYKALQADSQNVDLRLEFAFLLAAMRKNPQAIGQFRQVLKLQPNQPRAHLGLGLVLMVPGNEQQSRYHLNRAVDLDPTLRSTLTRAGIRLGNGERELDAEND